MFQNRYSSNSQRGQINESVNTDEHQSTQSPAAIIDEMETIFFTDPSGNIDPDLVDSYLARLDELVPLEETDDIEGVRETFKNKHALLIQDHFCDDNVVPIRKPKHSLRKVVVIAIAVFLSSVLGLVAYAENSNSSFAQWIDEIFSFSEILVFPLNSMKYFCREGCRYH